MSNYCCTPEINNIVMSIAIEQEKRERSKLNAIWEVFQNPSDPVNCGLFQNSTLTCHSSPYSVLGCVTCGYLPDQIVSFSRIWMVAYISGFCSSDLSHSDREHAGSLVPPILKFSSSRKLLGRPQERKRQAMRSQNKGQMFCHDFYELAPTCFSDFIYHLLSSYNI